MNAGHEEGEKALAHRAPGASAMSQADRIDWSQQDPRQVIQKIRVLEALLLGYFHVLAAKQDKTARMILRANPSFAEGFNAVIHGFKQEFAEVRGSLKLLRDEACVRACAEDVILEVTHVLAETERPLAVDEPAWMRQERMALAVKCLCIGFHGMLHGVECMTRPEATYDEDFRRGVLRGLALLGILPSHIERLLPRIEDLGFHVHCFEGHVTSLITSY